MSTYLDLVNKVLEESGKEQTLLTEDTFDSQEAGRRIYPRVKRLVREAWKAIQMSKNEWEFKTAELHTTVYPRLKYDSAYSDSGYVEFGTYIGEDTGTTIQVDEIFPDNLYSGWYGDGKGQIQFELLGESRGLTMGEWYYHETEDAGFRVVEKGSYDFMNETFGLMREPHWTTFVAGKGSAYPNPIMYIPWDNFVYKSFSYTGTTQTYPAYVSQDFQGKMVFYPQPIAPFELSFVHDVAPQELYEPYDEPAGLPEEYHDWIAWLALMNLARYDKDPDLFAYAQQMFNVYQNRAERNLMPIPSYAASPYRRR